MTLEPDYSLQEVALALGMSTRWVRNRINIDGAEHIRYGHKIRFTTEQVDKLREGFIKGVTPAVEVPDDASVTTRRKKSA